MPDILPWESGGEILKRLRRHLLQGQLVALPSESIYHAVASALDPKAVAQLASVADPCEPITLLLRHPSEIHDWAPFLSALGDRLIRNFWPGPLTLIAETPWATACFERLPAESKKHLGREGFPALTILHHEAMQHLAHSFGEPLAIAALAGPAISAETSAASAGDRLALIADTGRTQFGKPATVVDLNGRGYRIVQEGAVSPREIESAATCHILFVCTGNTCRSPMAERICAKLLSDRLGCATSELKQRGFSVQSAGLAAIMGAEASPEAVVVVEKLGADLRNHRSQSLNIDLLAEADFLFTMTGNHFRMLHSLLGGVGPTPRLLDPHGEDVADPIGGTPEAYRQCASQILTHLQSHLPEILES